MHLKSLLFRPRTFQGGIYLPVEEVMSAGTPVQAFPRPRRLTIPMIQHAGPGSTPIVEVGQQVCVGQLIGQAKQHGAVNVHAPLAGHVSAITYVDTALHPDVPAIQIDTDDAKN